MTHGQHFSCSLSAVMIGRLRDHGGDAAVQSLLQEAGSTRGVEYLLDTGNWISYDEAVALWRAGARVTRHPSFARAVGEEAGRRLNASPVAALLRSLGSPEEVYRRIADSARGSARWRGWRPSTWRPAARWSRRRAVDGFPRDADRCGWTCGLTSRARCSGCRRPASARTECAALGAPACRYEIAWDGGEEASASAAHDALRYQLDAMRERLAGVFAAAADLISADDLSGPLARITDRAAVEVRAPRYLLAVRTEGLHCTTRASPPRRRTRWPSGC